MGVKLQSTTVQGLESILYQIENVIGNRVSLLKLSTATTMGIDRRHW